MSLTPAEKKLRKLTRLPANCICANCGTASKVGFSTICIKYHTFVCSNCKSSHQAISHRCKSVTMSTWNDAEVEELRQKGNDYARRTWLKNAPPVGSGGRPKQGDQIDLFKRFVVDAYERKRYYGEDEGPQTPATAPRRVTPQAPPVTRQASPARAPVTVAAPAPAPVADLLDFAASSQPVLSQPAPAFQANFDAFGSSTPVPVASAPVASQSGFGFISSPPAAVAPTSADPFAAQPTTTSTPVSASGFGFIKPPPAASPPTQAPTPVAAPSTSSGSAFGFISSSPVPAAASSNGGSFADFSGMSTSTQVSSAASVHAVKKPIMGNSNGQAASMISSMDMSSQSKSQSTGMGFGMPQPGFGGGMQSQSGFGGGSGMQANMMGFSPQQQQQMMMMQQQQMMMQQQRMMQQNMMGMNMNNNGMNPMMGGINGNGMNPMVMGNQRQMGFSNGAMGNTNPGSSAQSMNSLDMNVSSMSAYTSGGKK